MCLTTARSQLYASTGKGEKYVSTHVVNTLKDEEKIHDERRLMYSFFFYLFIHQFIHSFIYQWLYSLCWALASSSVS
jgi:hypothetical protein